MSKSEKTRLFLPLFLIIPALLGALLLTGCSAPEPPELRQATLLPVAKAVADFKLTDQTGRPFTLDNLEGRWTLAFFGYTHCPDVCPTSMAMLGQVQRNLAKDPNTGELPQVVFFSVDPERDTPELLASFVPYFHASFIGVTGDADEILKLTRQLGIIYGKVEGSGSDAYLVDHSAAIILFDPQGQFRALFNVPHKPENIVADLQAIKQYYEATR
jgi:protein SCO1/2